MDAQKFEPQAAAPENPLESNGLNPDPENLLEEAKYLDLSILRRLVGQSVISIKQFDRPLVCEISKFAAMLQATEIASSHPLDGKLIITAFFEASTRTRLSFESAVLRLDGKVISIPEGRSTGTAKGESLEDVGEMFNAYGDAVIMRHIETDSIERVRNNLRLPLINAGNGSGEHPTQALADWYALLKWKPELANHAMKDSEKIKLGIIGTPGSMRAVKSFLLTSLLFKHAIERIYVISEMAEPLGEDLNDDLRTSGLKYDIRADIKDVLEDLDVIYMNSIAFLGDSYRSLDSRFKLNEKSKIKEEAVVMHPLARLDELSITLDNTSHNLYFTQAHGAVYVRQAMLISILDRFDKLPSSILKR